MFKHYIKFILVSIIFVCPAFSDPVLEIKPDPLKFGYISIGGCHERNIILYNVGDEILTLDSCRFEPSFTIDSLAGIAIEPDDSVVLSIIFAPEYEGDFSGGEVFYYHHLNNHEYELSVFADGIRAFQGSEIISSYQHIDNVVCLTMADDYNDDGFRDIVAEAYYPGATGNPLACISGSGFGASEVIWSVLPPGGQSDAGGYGDNCLALAGDLNNDGFGDIIRGTAWYSRTIYAIDGLTGDTVWSHNTYQDPNSGWIYSVAGTDDANDDGVPEVLAGAGSNANKAYCLDGATGELIWLYIADDGVSSIISFNDVNRDGVDEAVFASRDNGEHVYCISGASVDTGEAIWIFDVDDDTYALASIDDINDDWVNDIIVGTWGTGVYALSGRSSDPNGTLLWHYPMAHYVMRVVTCPDLDGDGYHDVLIGSWSSYAISVSGRNGAEIWRFNCGGDVWTIDYIEDVSGDSVVDIAAGSFNNKVYLIDGASGTGLWQRNIPTRPFTLRGIDDVNGDGFAEIAVGTELDQEFGGEVYIIAGGSVDPSSITYKEPPLPTKNILISNYPNPFNNSTIIRFYLESDIEYNLSIYDITGRLVERLTAEGRQGLNSIRWSPKGKLSLASGVYFCRLEAGVQRGLGKMVYLK